MEIKINKMEFDTVMTNLNNSINNFTDENNATMDDMITVWSLGETDAPAFNQYLQRLIGANSLLTNYYHKLLVSNSEAINKIGLEYMKLDDSAANDFDANTSVNYLYGAGNTIQPPFPNGGMPTTPQPSSPLTELFEQNGVMPQSTTTPSK